MLGLVCGNFGGQGAFGAKVEAAQKTSSQAWRPSLKNRLTHFPMMSIQRYQTKNSEHLKQNMFVNLKRRKRAAAMEEWGVSLNR